MDKKNDLLLREDAYYMPDGGDINVYLSINDVSKINDKDIKNYFKKRFDLDVLVEYDDMHIYITDNKYRFTEEYFKLIDEEEKRDIIMEQLDDCDSEYIEILKHCNSEYLFDCRSEYDCYLLYCYILYLSSLNDSFILVYDTFNGRYLNINEIERVVFEYENRKIEYVSIGDEPKSWFKKHPILFCEIIGFMLLIISFILINIENIDSSIVGGLAFFSLVIIVGSPLLILYIKWIMSMWHFIDNIK